MTRGHWHSQRLLREALESGEASRLGLDREFITAMPARGPPFPDGVARALADEANLEKLARDYDPFDCGLRDVWETTVVSSTFARTGLFSSLLDHHGQVPRI